MKKIIWCLLLSSTISYAGVIKIRNAGQPDVYVPTMDSDNTSNLTVKGKVVATTGNITTINATTINAPGFVPLGGMIAVMPYIHANAWQPPATGVIKDGFMRADGNTVPPCTGCGIPTGTMLPNMGAKYVKGSSTSGTTDGSNTVSASFSGTPASYSVSVPAHYHGFSLSAAGQTLSSTTATSTITRASVVQDYCATGPGGGITHGVCPTTSPTQPYVATIDIGHSHSSSTVSGTVGTGLNGNLPFTASGSNTPAGSVTVSPTIGTAGNNEPAYIEVVWVIRVK